MLDKGVRFDQVNCLIYNQTIKETIRHRLDLTSYAVENSMYPPSQAMASAYSPPQYCSSYAAYPRQPYGYPAPPPYRYNASSSQPTMYRRGMVEVWAWARPRAPRRCGRGDDARRGDQRLWGRRHLWCRVQRCIGILDLCCHAVMEIICPCKSLINTKRWNRICILYLLA